MAVGLLALLCGRLFLAHWRPDLRAGEAYGVARYQGTVDWERVADDDIAFAYVKATEGGDLVDPRFDENWAGVERADLRRGAYHFFTLCRPGADQARLFLDVVPPDPEALPPAIDAELAGNCSDRPAAAALARELDVFVERVEEAWGRPVLLYVSDEWDEAYPTLDRLRDRPRWPRSMVRRPEQPWLVWQLHGFARVEGVDGRVDLDVGSPELLTGG